MPIRQYLRDEFDPDAIQVMSEALEKACAALRINGHIQDRQIIAARIIELARGGVLDAKVLAERVLADGRAVRCL